MTICDFFNIEKTIASELFANAEYPWDILSDIKSFILKAGPSLDPLIYQRSGDNIWIAKSAVIHPSAEIIGPAIIGENTEVRPSAYIRGSVIIGNSCVIGNSTEVKNSIIFDSVQIPHFNYVGDSILGYKSHLGAGAVTSNVKSDKTFVQTVYDGKRIDTKLKKFGAIVGDFVEVGCNSVLCPGTVIGRNTNVYPLSRVRGYVPPDSIFKSENNIIPKIQK